MYKEYREVFESPEPTDSLWRYMDFTKLVSLFDRRALFFAKADKLGDPFEGSFSKLNIDLRPGLYGDALERIDEAVRPFREALPRFTLVNCWHCREHESTAMWRLYAREHDGIAIRTTFEGLCESLTCTEDVYIGKVQYADYEKDFIPEGNSFSPFLYKRKGFEHEYEVRAIIQDLPLRSNPYPQQWKDIYEVGNYLAVELSTLIKDIIVAPFAPNWFLDLVRSVTSLYEVNIDVAQSELAGSPNY